MRTWHADAIGFGLACLALRAVQELHPPPAAALLITAGVVLIGGLLAGRLGAAARLPRLTGYLLAGVVLSPDLPVLLGGAIPALIPRPRVAELRLVNDLALGVIALLAGTEIRWRWLRSHLPTIAGIAAWETALVPAASAGAFLLLASLPMTAPPLAAAVQDAGLPLWGVAGLLGVVLLANSPTVVVSVLKELGASGPLARTVMGTSVLVDAVVVVLFAVAAALLKTAPGGGLQAVAGAALAVGGGLLLSVAIGLGLGWAIGLMAAHGGHRLPWVLVGAALLAASLGPLAGIEPLFCLLAAGLAAGERDDPVVRLRLEGALSRVALPVFVIFFVAAGLTLDLRGLLAAAPAVLALSATRLLAVWYAVRRGSLGADPVVGRLGWTAMVSQAGITLVLAQVVADQFPGWGRDFATLIISLVALHQLIGPPLLAWALRRAGEASTETPKAIR